MNKELHERIGSYHLSMSLAKTMLQKGIITDEDYEKISTILRKKYNLSLSTLCL